MYSTSAPVRTSSFIMLKNNRSTASLESSSSSPTHSIFLAIKQQKDKFRFRGRQRKHLRNPPAFGTYLHSRSVSTTSLSSLDDNIQHSRSESAIFSDDLWTSEPPSSEQGYPSIKVDTALPEDQPVHKFVRNISAALRHTGLLDIHEDAPLSEATSDSGEWDLQEEEDSSEEEFFFATSPNRSRRGSINN